MPSRRREHSLPSITIGSMDLNQGRPNPPGSYFPLCTRLPYSLRSSPSTFPPDIKYSQPLNSTALNLLGHRWQTQGLRDESGPPPSFIRPGTLFLPSSTTPSEGVVTFIQSYNYIGPLKATSRLMWPPVKMRLTPLP